MYFLYIDTSLTNILLLKRGYEPCSIAHLTIHSCTLEEFLEGITKKYIFANMGKNVFVYFSRIRKETQDWGPNQGLREGTQLDWSGPYCIFRVELHYGVERNFVCSWRRPNCRSQVIDLSLSAIGFSNNLKLHFAVLEEIV